MYEKQPSSGGPSLNRLRICALCRHLEVVEKNREFARVVDSEFMVYRCRKLNVQKREDYLMEPVPTHLERPQPTECPFWEPFVPEEEPVFDLSGADCRGWSEIEAFCRGLADDAEGSRCDRLEEPGEGDARGVPEGPEASGESV